MMLLIDAANPARSGLLVRPKGLVEGRFGGDPYHSDPTPRHPRQSRGDAPFTVATCA
jgi:hypothetical protein